MIAYLILGIGLLIGGLLLARWYVQADPRRVVSALKWVALGIAIGLALFVLLSKQFWLLFAALPFLMGARSPLRTMLGRIKTGFGPTPGRRSKVRTRFLEMELDHDTGAMDGEVVEGPFAGRLLAEMQFDELIQLWRACQADPRSLQVLEAFLDRSHGPDWRDEVYPEGEPAGGHAGGASGEMSREEAFELLGLPPGASAQEIREAHRRLMRKFHPDAGGSDYLAQRINQAKDIALGRG